jgi:hypothetical protein
MIRGCSLDHVHNSSILTNHQYMLQLRVKTVFILTTGIHEEPLSKLPKLISKMQ